MKSYKCPQCGIIQYSASERKLGEPCIHCGCPGADGADYIDPAWKMDQAIKADAGKPKLSLVPTQIIKDIAEIREYGNKKYGEAESWRRVEKARYIDALYRHLLDYIDDNKSVADDSGLGHIKHIACNVAFLCEMESDEWKLR